MGSPWHQSRHWCGVLLPICIFAAFLLFAPSLFASDNELQLTVGPGYSALPEIGDGMNGIGGGIEVSYSFTAFWSVVSGGFTGFHFQHQVDAEDPDDEPEIFEDTTVTAIWLGPRFSLDVFSVIPFVSLAPELLLTSGELQPEQEELDFGLRWTLGFDYRPARNWSLGFEVNYHSFLEQPLDYPVFITTMFRFSFHHGFSTL